MKLKRGASDPTPGGVRQQPALPHQIFKAGPHHLLAECFAKTGQNEKAEEAFKRALEIEPDSPGILHDFAHFLHRTDRSLEALQTLHSVMAKGINSEQVWHLGSFIANTKPEFVEFAVDWTGEAIRHFPEHEGIRMLRGEALLKAGRLRDALPFFQQSPHAEDPSAQAPCCSVNWPRRKRSLPCPRIWKRRSISNSSAVPAALACVRRRWTGSIQSGA